MSCVDLARIMESTGRGTFHKIGTFDSEDDREHFPLVKKRLLSINAWSFDVAVTGWTGDLANSPTCTVGSDPHLDLR